MPHKPNGQRSTPAQPKALPAIHLDYWQPWQVSINSALQIGQSAPILPPIADRGQNTLHFQFAPGPPFSFPRSTSRTKPDD